MRMMASSLPWSSLHHAPQSTSNWEPGSTYFQRGRLVRRAAPRTQPPARFPAAYMTGHYHGSGHEWPDYCDLPTPSMPQPRDPLRQHAANIRRLERELRQVRGEPEQPRRRRRRSHSPALSSVSSSSSISSSFRSASTCSSADNVRPRFTCPRTARDGPAHLHRQPPTPHTWPSPYGNEDYAYDYGFDQGRGYGMPSYGSFRQGPTRPRRVSLAVSQPRWQDLPLFDPSRGQGLVREPRWR